MTNKEIQKYLNKFNAGLTVDGILGTKSNFWIKGIQYAGGLTTDGIFGSKTLAYAKTIVNKTNKNTVHFSQSEFNCHCCGSNCGIHINLLILLESIRYYFKKSITITSGYRCESHNEAVDGASNSQHLYGTAGDIKVSGISPSKVYDLANDMNVLGGVGSYSTFIHVDSRGYKSRW